MMKPSSTTRPKSGGLSLRQILFAALLCCTAFCRRTAAARTLRLPLSITEYESCKPMGGTSSTVDRTRIHHGDWSTEGNQQCQCIDGQWQACLYVPEQVTLLQAPNAAEARDGAELLDASAKSKPSGTVYPCQETSHGLDCSRDRLLLEVAPKYQCESAFNMGLDPVSYEYTCWRDVGSRFSNVKYEYKRPVLACPQEYAVKFRGEYPDLEAFCSRG